jgi:sugar lactone lactonase YvrE
VRNVSEMNGGSFLLEEKMNGSWFAFVARAACVFALGFSLPPISHGQVVPPKFEVDPSWPKPLPDRWVTGIVGWVCVDAHDHIFILNRRNLTDNELDAGHQAPPVIEFDPEGNVVNAWGDPDVLPDLLHGCFIDHEGNFWVTGEYGNIVQKWTHDGGKLLLQIGTRGVFDSSDGTLKGKSLNSSHTLFFRSAGLVVDPQNGDIYVADGNGNHRVAVFDRDGKFLRQWELQHSKAETEPGGALHALHSIAMSKDGFVYVCDRQGDQAQVFDKMGNFQKSIPVPFEQRSQYPVGPGHTPGAWGTVDAIAFSPDAAQTFMYIADEDDEQIVILNRADGRILSSFGRAGHQVGEFVHAHSLAVDSKGNIYVGEVDWGERVQKFKIVDGQ